MYWLEFAGEDDPFAALEASTAAVDVCVRGPGCGTASAIEGDRVADLALVHAAGELLGRTDASVVGARTLLEAATIDRSGSVAVRARDVRGSAGVDTQHVERELGDVLVDRGFSVDLDDPDHTLRALFARGDLGLDPAATGAESSTPDGSTGERSSSPDEPTDERSSTSDEPTDERSSTSDGSTDEQPFDSSELALDVLASDRVDVADDADAADVCLLGWVDVERAGAFGDRMPTDRPFFQPGSMDPALARALVNLAGARPGARIADPMCGTGGTCLEAALVGADVVGVDAQAKMVRGTRQNLGTLAPADAEATVVRGDARRLPLVDDVADGLVVDVPYERQSAVAADDLEDLVTHALSEARRVAERAVVVGDRSWTAAARDAGWTVACVHRRRVHRSLVRSIHVLERPNDDCR